LRSIITHQRFPLRIGHKAEITPAGTKLHAALISCGINKNYLAIFQRGHAQRFRGAVARSDMRAVDVDGAPGRNKIEMAARFAPPRPVKGRSSIMSISGLGLFGREDRVSRWRAKWR
jgi:hypothetical protein